MLLLLTPLLAGVQLLETREVPPIVLTRVEVQQQYVDRYVYVPGPERMVFVPVPATDPEAAVAAAEPSAQAPVPTLEPVVPALAAASAISGTLVDAQAPWAVPAPDGARAGDFAEQGGATALVTAPEPLLVTSTTVLPGSPPQQPAAAPEAVVAEAAPTDAPSEPAQPVAAAAPLEPEPETTPIDREKLAADSRAGKESDAGSGSASGGKSSKGGTSGSGSASGGKGGSGGASNSDDSPGQPGGGNPQPADLLDGQGSLRLDRRSGGSSQGSSSQKSGSEKKASDNDGKSSSGKGSVKTSGRSSASKAPAKSKNR
ncbi:MAG: hypothetical protein IT307_10305 [Chloroflexi bacterium]|nr:hypothetical protein [Chloroflexota bacterium]